jgi:hypothetical protein
LTRHFTTRQSCSTPGVEGLSVLERTTLLGALAFLLDGLESRGRRRRPIDHNAPQGCLLGPQVPAEKVFDGRVLRVALSQKSMV